MARAGTARSEIDERPPQSQAEARVAVRRVPIPGVEGVGGIACGLALSMVREKVVDGLPPRGRRKGSGEVQNAKTEYTSRLGGTNVGHEWA